MGHIKRERYIHVIGIFSTLAFILLFIYTFTPIYFRTDSADASYTPAETTLSIIASKDTASVEAVPDSANGTFVISNTLNEAEFTVSTNNLTGYSLNILSTDSSGQLVNTNTGDALSTIASDTTEDDFRNGSASTYVNKWGYRLKINGTTTTNFLSAPTTTNRTIHTTSEPNTPGTSDNFTLGIGARIDYTKPPGTYTNTFVLTAVGNPITYQINYLDNSSGSDVAILPAEGSSNITASAFTLSSTIPTRVGYDFKGWCDGTVDHETSPSTCDGVVYDASDSFVFSNASTSGVAEANLYAMWEFVPIPLYDQIASMSKGTQTAADLKEYISQPTSTDPATDTSSSGVYEYNVSEFGVATDATNTHKIYYYRGILDTSENSGYYGSSGLADAYPNYVKLGNTCWRIVRTTGSGGMKMIYSGLYGATVANSCANAEDNAKIGSSFWSGDSTSSSQLVRAGYTYNNNYASNTKVSRQIGVLFGTNSNFSGNTTNSSVKTIVENWYNNTLSSYTNHLEPSAGYCNDRTIYDDSSVIQLETVNVLQYDTSSSIHFGPEIRDYKNMQPPSLTCATYGGVDRSTVDLYTTNLANGGNKQLAKPIALLTADEAVFAGSGAYPNAGTGQSFLNSGDGYWLLSPYAKRYGYVHMFALANSILNSDIGAISDGIRPVISLSSDTKIMSGSGIATDPWEVTW